MARRPGARRPRQAAAGRPGCRRCATCTGMPSTGWAKVVQSLTLSVRAARVISQAVSLARKFAKTLDHDHGRGGEAAMELQSSPSCAPRVNETHESRPNPIYALF